VVLDRPAFLKVCFANKGTRSEQFPFLLTKDKLNKISKRGKQTPIAFILALLAKNLIAKRKTICFLILVKKLCFQRRHINIRGTFARTRFATHTQIKYFI
jgi:hypothetical protein